MQRKWVFATALCFACMGLGGCNVDLDELEDLLDEIDVKIGAVAGPLQTVDPRVAVLPQGLDESDIIINNNVVVVNNIQQDLIVEELPDATLLGFENITGFDAYITYLADGVLQGILVFDGETLLLDYPCLSDVELISEEHFDVFTGVLVESFDLQGFIFFNPDDFLCGDALILTFDPTDILVTATPIDLID